MSIFFKFLKKQIRNMQMHKPIVKNGTLNFEDLLSLNPDFAPFPVGKFTLGIMPKVTVIDYEKGNVKLKIGNYCSIGDGVGILLNDSHRPDWITTYPFSNVLGEFREVPGLPVSKGDITIGNDVWIGRNVLILSGVNIGDGAVVGAGSIVTKDVPPYTIVVGNPAHFVKKRFEQETIDE
jgi:virginiamycin A acetyltransferase